MAVSISDGCLFITPGKISRSPIPRVQYACPVHLQGLHSQLLVLAVYTAWYISFELGTLSIVPRLIPLIYSKTDGHNRSSPWTGHGSTAGQSRLLGAARMLHFGRTHTIPYLFTPRQSISHDAGTLIALVVFGSFHLVAWRFSFPSDAE